MKLKLLIPLFFILVFTGCWEDEMPKRFISVYDIRFINVGDNNHIALSKGETYLISFEIFPNNADDKSVTWISDNHNIASVNQNGLVQGHNPGVATITVIANDGGINTSCFITIPPEKSTLYGAWTGSNNFGTFRIVIDSFLFYQKNIFNPDDEYIIAYPEWGAINNLNYNTPYPWSLDIYYPTGYMLWGQIDYSNFNFKADGYSQMVHFFIHTNLNQMIFSFEPITFSQPLILYRE